MHSAGRQDREKTHCSATNHQVDNPLRYVTELRPYDILMGRGAPIIHFEGNVSFRELVRLRKADYINSTRHQEKDKIARQILQEIRLRGGHFLKRVDSETEIQRLGVPEGTKVWIIVENDVAIEKVKQALRDKDADRKNEDDSSSESVVLQQSFDISPEPRSFSAPSFLTDVGWVDEHRSHLHELLRSQSAPSNLAFQTNFHDDLLVSDQSHAHNISAQVDHFQPTQSFAGNLTPAASSGRVHTTSDYLHSVFRRNDSLPFPAFTASRNSKVSDQLLALYQRNPALQSVHPLRNQVDRISMNVMNQNDQLPHFNGPYLSTHRLTDGSLLPIAHSIEQNHPDTSSRNHMLALKSLLEEQEIVNQRQLLFGTNTSPLEFSPAAVAAHLGGFREQDSKRHSAMFSFSRHLVNAPETTNTVARMPLLSQRGLSALDRKDEKYDNHGQTPMKISDDRKRKARETQALTALTGISSDHTKRKKQGKDSNNNSV